MDDLHAPPGSPPTPTLLLRAKDPAIEGETVRVTLGETVTCGRSRRCHWSLKRTVPYLENRNGARERLEESLAFRSVSRRHCRIAFLALDMVEVENLSSNGTLVDGRPVDRLVLLDCRTRAHTLQLGPEGLLLELAPGSLPI
jgi:pSer/pThr/pTyr-binding forkhead associated (FHA) protein